MIPLQLRVRNFMCYRDDVPTLDFSGIHLACLTGANGHGKSALLDAMTWSVWGKARAKRDDDLIYLGRSEMEVEFTFDLAGSVYRVLRKRDSAKRGRTLLDLQVEHDGVFRSIAEPTIRATQAAIIRLLRMDYETFTNSAFLLQGKADAFTTRTPAERKRVLGEILGLSLYDEYEQRAKEKAKEKTQELLKLEGLLRDVDRELARQPEYESEAELAQQQVATLSAAVKEAEALLRESRHEQQALASKQSQLQNLKGRLARAERDLSDIEGEISAGQRRLEVYDRTLAERQQVEEGHAALVEAREAEGVWNQRLAQHAQVQEQQRIQERAVDAARRDLDLARERLAARVRELEGRAAKGAEHENQLVVVRARLDRFAELQVEREGAQGRIQDMAQESAGLQVRNEQLRAEMDAIKEKVDLLAEEAGEAQCPLCGQALTTAHRDQLSGEFQAEGTDLAAAHRENSARQRATASETKELEGQTQRLDRELKNQPAQQRREAQLEQALADAQQAAGEVEAARAELASQEERLQSRDYAPEAQAELARLAAELETLAYSSEAHEQARADAASLTGFEERYRNLQLAVDRVDQERIDLEKRQAQQQRWQQTLAEDMKQRDSLSIEVERLPEVEAQVRLRARDREDLQAQSSRARMELGAAQQKLDHCIRLAEERVRHEANRKQQAGEKAIYEELRLAFGKKGIQAMIIEAAVPEIEGEANRLLARMTSGRMHVRFETQRETLKGDTIETLDIKIADELGTRSYELFSGGEAFRVNFAIRIALSKLLARRAGAQLQMLVIDEGFGTQDAEGRERLVEAITSIQDDFSRILVITHIEELKDAFPVWIEVAKTESGSQFRLS